MAFGLKHVLGLLGLGGLGGLAASAGKIGGKGFSSFLKGDPEKERQFQRFTPEQQDVLSNLLRQGAEETNISGLENLARKRFQEETIPSIAERFTAMGAGSQGSSAFQSSLGRAGSDLEAQLGALRSQQGMQKLGLGLQPSFETAFSPATPGFLQGGSQALLQSLPMLLKFL